MRHKQLHSQIFRRSAQARQKWHQRPQKLSRKVCLLGQRLFLLLTYVLLLFPSSAGLAGVTLQQKFDFTERIGGAIQKATLQTLRTRGTAEEKDVLVTVGIAIDEEALARALQEEAGAGAASDTQRLDELTARLREAVRAINQENTASDPESPVENLVVANGMRFGPLNLDVLAGERLPIRQPRAERGSAESRSPSVILALQLPAVTGEEGGSRSRTHEIEITDFITQVTVRLVLPAGTAEDLTAEVRAAATRTLAVFVPERLVSTAEFNISPAAAVDLKTQGDSDKPLTMAEDPLRYLAENVLDPKNPSLSGLFLALALILGGLMASFVLWRASGGLIAALANLQATKSAEGSGTDASAGLVAQEAQPQGLGASDSRVKVDASGLFDSSAEAHALTTELSRLRTLFEEALAQDSMALSEGLDEILRDDQGLTLARQMSAFLGHGRFEPLVQGVTPSLGDALRDHLLQNASAPVQTLSGADSARRLLGQWNLRRVQLRSLGGGTPEQIAEARQALLGVDDKVLFPWLEGNGENPSAGWIFRALTQGRRLQALRRLSPGVSRTYALSLEEPGQAKGDLAGEAKKILVELQQSAPAVESERSKLVRQLLAQMKLTDEKLLLGLLNGPDWELRRMIAESAYLFADLIYLEVTFLQSLVEKRKVQDKANVLYLLPVDLRTRVLGSYENESRAKEVLLLELKLIETNRKRLDQLLSQKDAVIGGFMADVRTALARDVSQIDLALREMASQNGWDPPTPSDAAPADDLMNGVQPETAA